MRHTIPILNPDDQPAIQVDPTRPERACLVKIYPAVVSGSLIPLTQQEVIFGRGSNCDFELADDFSSRHHATFQWHENDCYVYDLGSTNGTYVNDERISKARLRSGDQIRIGTHIFKYLVSDHVEAMYHEAVFEMMTVDALTQTYNRRYFDDFFQREVTRSARYKRSLGLILLDIDYFKGVNDTFGHLIGDELLSGLCKRISDQIHRDEVFARIGGEEFAIAVVEIDRDSLSQFAGEICRLVRETPFSTSRGRVPLTVSIGVAHTKGGKKFTTKDIFEKADSQLYKAKSLGRDRFCV